MEYYSIPDGAVPKLGALYRLVYIKRNEELIDSSNICIFYYKYNFPNSGTATAFKYAQKHKKRIIEIV